MQCMSPKIAPQAKPAGHLPSAAGESPPPQTATDVFHQLALRNTGRMYAVARRILRDDEAARDCVQDSFLAAFRGFAGFEGRAVLTTWLHTVVVHTALAHLKARRAFDRPFDDQDPPIDASGCRVEDHAQSLRLAEAELEGALDRTRVRQAIAALPDQHRAILVLRDIEGYSTLDTAQLLEISPAAAKVRLHRARIALRDALITTIEGPRS